MVEFNEEIMKKVKRKEEESKYVARCLEVKICPVCGEDLGYRIFDDGGSEYRCLSKSCNFADIE